MLNANEIRPELFDRFEGGRTSIAHLPEAMTLGDAAGALERRRGEPSMRIDDVGRCWIGNEP